MQICVITPSRGLVHSRTIQSIRENIKQVQAYEHVEWEHFFTHDKGIPEAQNYLVKKALHWGADYIWSVEEDNLIPTEALNKMLHYMKLLDAGVVCVDYPVGARRCSTVCRKKNKILWCGLGCTLIGSWVFRKIGKPWFSTDKSWKIISKHPLQLLEQDIPNKYGGHDIFFGMQCQKHNILIGCVPDMIAGHIKPKESVAHVRKSASNSEAIRFEIWDTIEEYQNYD